MRKKRLGQAESDVLRYIVDRHPITVRDVAEHFERLKGHTKTTTLNVLERLREKGFLQREQQDGLYHYSPTQTKTNLLSGLVRDFVEGMLGGSLEPFANYLAEHPQISQAELARLKESLAEIEEKQRHAAETASTDPTEGKN